MEIRSRFLNADCDVDRVYREGDHLYVEGVVKGLMPVQIGIDPIDAARILLRSLNLPTLSFWASVPGALLRGLAMGGLDAIGSWSRPDPSRTGKPAGPPGRRAGDGPVAAP